MYQKEKTNEDIKKPIFKEADAMFKKRKVNIS